MNNQLIDSVVLAAITGVVSLFLIILILILYFKNRGASDNEEKKESPRKTRVYPLRDRPLERETAIDSGYRSIEYKKDDGNACRTKQKHKTIGSRSQPTARNREDSNPDVKKCPYCEGEIGRFSIFCRNCGAMVKGRY